MNPPPNPPIYEKRSNSFLCARGPLKSLVLTVYILLPMLAMAVLATYAQYQLARKWIIENSYLLAKTVILRQEQIFLSAESLATTLSELEVVRDENHPQRCNTVFANILAKNPLYANLGVANLAGNNWCSAVPMTEPITVADRSHFQEAIAKKNFALGQYTIGRIVHVPVVQSAYPVLDDQDTVQQVVLVVLSLDWLNKTLTSANLPTNSELAIVDSNGTIMAHYPYPETWQGKNISESIGEISLNQTSPYETLDIVGKDGIHRWYTISQYADNTGKEVFLLIGIPEKYFTTQALTAIQNNLVIMFILGLIIFLVVITDWQKLFGKIRSKTA